jgi:dihydroneopterin aldolase/2-amino-4-hydroxy-6-hydroxymethyldihydropteridine diphosphokinase
MTWTSSPYDKAGIELDRITVEGIRAAGRHGVLPEEREKEQPFIADVVVHLNTRDAGRHDDLTRTVNYAEVAQLAAAVLSGPSVELIETLADRIALSVLELSGVECVDVRVHKPEAPIPVPFSDVTVTIRRDLRSGDVWADKRVGSSAGMPHDPLKYGESEEGDIFDVRPLQPVPALLALGGNLGEVESTLVDAVYALSRIPGIHVEATSPLVSSAPAGGPPQPDYLNAVVRITTALTPRELLAACHGIEMVHGRERGIENGPRTLDIDIIDVNGIEGVSPDLTLPHPRAAQRGFVLVPWARMEPNAVLPGVGPIADAAAALASTVTLRADPWPGRR